MKISCIQMDIQLFEPDKNFESAKELIRKAAENNPDVIVLPEMWNTGFFLGLHFSNSIRPLCDTDGQRVKSEIGSLAGELNINIVAGSVANIKNNKMYNTAYIFDRSGECIAEYDKTHLFSPLAEHLFFEKGNQLCRFKLDGIDCGIIICYDLRFPEISRTLALEGMDILFIAAQWPDIRVDQMHSLAQARAIENQIYVVCCNSCGKTDETVFGGRSAIYDPFGDFITHAESGERIITGECGFIELEYVRMTIPVFNDRQTELYDLND